MQRNAKPEVNLNAAADEKLVYKYFIDIATTNFPTGSRDFGKITEYYIPSSKICFNKFHIAKSEQPRNIPTSRLFDLRKEPLTRVMLPKALVNDIEKVVEGPFYPCQEVPKDLLESEQYQSLFKTKTLKTVLIDDRIITLKGNFWDRYETQGNSVVKKALIKYILNGEIKYGIPLNDILQLAKKLDPMEKESLIKSMRADLANHDKMRSHKINSVEEKHSPDKYILSGILGTVAVMLINGLRETSNSIPSLLLGFIGGSLLEYIEYEAEKYMASQACDQRENRLATILNELDRAPENNFTLNII